MLRKTIPLMLIGLIALAGCGRKAEEQQAAESVAGVKPPVELELPLALANHVPLALPELGGQLTLDAVVERHRDGLEIELRQFVVKCLPPGQVVAASSPTGVSHQEYFLAQMFRQ